MRRVEVMLFDEEIMQAFESMAKARQDLVALLKQKTSKTLEQDYVFSDGTRDDVSLSELFKDRADLIVIHNMGKSCRWCTLWADGLNGLQQHLQARAEIVIVSPDTPKVQQEFAQGRGWSIRMLSDVSGSFTSDMGFATTENGQRYVLPGVSTFHKMGDGSIVRVSADGFGPGDVYMPVYPLFDLLQDGSAEWEPQYTYAKPISIEL